MSSHYRGWAELFEGKVYLVGGLGSSEVVDVFDTATEEVGVLPVSLSFGNSMMIGFRQGDVLYLGSGSAAQPLSLTLLSSGIAELGTDIHLQLGVNWFRSSPVVSLGSKFYVLIYETVLVETEISTGDVSLIRNRRV